MKRILLVIMSLLVAIPLALGLVAGLSYYTTAENTVPRPVITVMEQEVRPSGYDWNSPVFGGILYRQFTATPASRFQDIGSLTDPLLSMNLPDGYYVKASVAKSGEEVFSGSAEQLASYQFLDNGVYKITLLCERPATDTSGHGTLCYQFTFDVVVEPRIEYGNDWVKQGDVMAVRVYNLPEDTVPTLQTNLGRFAFTKGDNNQYTAFVPISHDVPSGGTDIVVAADTLHWEISMRIVESSFPIQQMVQNDTLTLEEQEAQNANRLNTYRASMELITPLFETADEQQHWDGLFLSPVEGNIATDYGLFQYYTGNPTPERHTGIDIAASRGTQVISPAAGRVVFAGWTNYTGNTLVIEHGGGLKSLFYHLEEVFMEEDEMVHKGEVIATIGSSGYADSTHLHYEVRLGSSTLNPKLLFSGASGLYYFG